MSRLIGIVMDPISAINIKKDSSFAMLLAAQAKGWTIQYMEQQDLYLSQGKVMASMRDLQVMEDVNNWYQLGEATTRRLSELDAILMRIDPPFDMEYIYSTYLLEQAQSEGVLVVNHPQSLRDANEKLFTAWFPQCCPPTLVTRKKQLMREFQQQHGDIIIKPLDGMGGASIFKVSQGDPNFSVIVETLTEQGKKSVMVQQYLPAIKDGDKRILLINGEPVPFALARIPADGETRGNLAAGGRGEGRPLTERDRWICQQVGPKLREKGLLFVGLDVIGDYLTEINVTSPTCIRELDRQFNLNIAGDLMNCIEAHL
ncbi:glutathione synthase [Methylophaga sp.]|jgi:glutathione synthase|uniref:glutathione synthase n=1 Tax=Methylophaga sp. TaxID=2024840 RepID=UPI000C0D7322|nr:glutathione synthase [Methylophaga sp.]MBL1456280.1 glutathione synthase [Methylophaga sp.]|tara:strand:- start:5892 stop:6836 length:945 start_codon:yes stop_codon:yes gene_type:complete